MVTSGFVRLIQAMIMNHTIDGSTGIIRLVRVSTNVTLIGMSAPCGSNNLTNLSITRRRATRSPSCYLLPLIPINRISIPCFRNNERIAPEFCQPIRSSVFYRLFFPKRSE